MSRQATGIDIERRDLPLDGRLDGIERSAVPDPSVMSAASAIVAEVAAGGDAALAERSRVHGGSLADGTTAVPPTDLAAAAAAVPHETLAAIDDAIARVRLVHERQRPSDDRIEPSPGIVVERVWSPLHSVGVYVPGGLARYPSSMIMGVVPAQIAGVGRVVVATPAGPDGAIDPVVLATAQRLGVVEVRAMGGAQAVAALAYGTETIAPVAKVVGPGGPWVTAAKLAIAGVCGVDLPAGPSEAAIVVDASADPVVAAADVMCQAEHGPESRIVLVSTSPATTDAILVSIEAALDGLDRSETIRRALVDHGLVIDAPTMDAALAFVDRWAPEHLSLHTTDARAGADAVPSAGSVFVGHWTPEAAGDYATGANHVLPTGGLARAYGPLGVEDFGSWRQIQTLDRSGLEAIAPTILALAGAEGFGAHARSVTVRLGEADR